MSKMQNLVVAVTPSNNRQNFLVNQHEVFFKAYQNHKESNPGAPELAWIIVDESPDPCAYYADTKFGGITYVHVPSRDNLDSIKEGWIQDLASQNLYTSEQLQARVSYLHACRSDRYRIAHDLSIPSIGELRNIAGSVAGALYGSNGDFGIFTKDDDDYSGPNLIHSVHGALQDNSFVKPKSMYMINQNNGDWYYYTIDRQNDPAVCIEDGNVSQIDRFVVWDNIAETKENKFGHEGIYGTMFSYRHSTYQQVEARRDPQRGLGAFEPISRREDIAFYEEIRREVPPDKIYFLGNESTDFVRIIHQSQTTRTFFHSAVNPEIIDPLVVQQVNKLCNNKALVVV